jgi:hypothetical protein
MARMIPTTPRDFHDSKGEERVYRALRALPDSVTVIHSLRWLHPGNTRALTQKLGAQGEGDFVIFDPSQGVLVIEVKGGRVWCERGEWWQENRRTGQKMPIDPEKQASDTLYRLRTEVLARVPEASRLLFGHAVWFPDGAVDRDKLPMNCTSEMTLDGESIARPEEALGRCFAYWRKILPGKGGASPENAEEVLSALAPTLSIVRSVRQTLDEREEQLIQLTREQARIIDFLDEQPHAAIIGAAGTGKTLLAIEKARRLASPDDPVLYLCYNALLRNHLRANHGQPNVRYANFHELALEVTGGAGSLDDAAARLVEHLMDDRPLDYGHVVIDEGQDFDADWLEWLKYRFREGTFYVFYDRHQAVQRQTETRWLDEIPCRLVLTRNCRNTEKIARSAYRIADLPQPTTFGVDGPAPRLHRAGSTADAVAVAERLVDAAIRAKTPPHDIAVLTMETMGERSPWQRERLGGQRTADAPTPGRVTVTTARRFKGLEASLVIVVDADFAEAGDPEWRRRLYVAASRARHAVHILTTTPEAALTEPLRILSGTEKVRPSWRALARELRFSLTGGTDDPFNEPEAG